MKTNKNMKLLKIGAGILCIIAIPILFFQLLGVNILDLNNTNKRIIAVVNEDMGLSKDDVNVQMGQEIVPILEKDSPYDWEVIGRGSAVNGLKSNQYEAIVYIPTNFSENIMSYDEENPKKAEFSYQVQDQKTGTRKDKVMDEVNAASNRVNDKVSTLYWSYVAQEMNHIKKEFTNIIRKETEFLSAMSGYYKPESETLAANMTNQKEQIEGLRSIIGDANNSHNVRIENAETFEQQIDGFVTYVQEYKGFQEKQKEILQQVQDESLAKIHAAAATQSEQFNQSVQALEENNEKLNSEIQKVNATIDGNQQKFNTLSDMRKSEVDRQLSDLHVVQGTAIDRYNNSILSNLEKVISAGKGGAIVVGPSNPIADLDQLNATKAEMVQKAAGKVAAVLPGLADERARVDGILAALSTMKAKVAETDPTSTFITEITQLETDLASVNSVISEKETTWSGANQQGTDDYVKATADYGDLVEDYNSLNGEYNSVQSILNSSPANTAQIAHQIKQKESSLLKNAGLSEAQRSRLNEIFATGAASTETSSLLSYYATLEQFEFTLNESAIGSHKDAILKDDILTVLLKNVVELNEIELEGWNTVSEGLPETQLGMSDLSTTFAAIMSGYEETVEEQHTALLSELDSIDQQANLLLALIETPATMLTSGEPVQTTTEGEVTAGQQNVSQQLLTLSDMMQSLSTKQSGIVNYATDLTVKAYDIKDTSDQFSTTWETNVEQMTEFDTDIQGFLANTYVDGQENGYAFNYLVNPLQVKGESTMTEEVKKVPPVILFIILLISSLLIGFFTYRIKEGSIVLRLALTGILSLLVGLIISLYSINMYVLNDQRAIEWTIFTILLLLASAAVIRAALEFGQSFGWVASVALMCLFISPLLILAVPEINIPDILSTVYMSIKYEPETSFVGVAVITAVIAIVMLGISYFITKKNEAQPVEQAYEN
jgi:putative membrane protein